MSLFSIAKTCEKKYEKFLSKITGEYNAVHYNILNPNFLTYHFMNMYVGEFSSRLCGTKGVLLDIGCGIKPYHRIFQNRVKKYYGLDYPEGINTDESRVLGTMENRPDLFAKPDIWGDGMHLPIKSRSIDTAVSFMVLEHISEPDLFLKEVNRVMRVDGIIILSTVQAYPIHHNKYDFYRYTRLGLRYLFEKNGCEIVSIKPHGRFFVHISEMINHYVNRRLFRNVKGNYLKIAGGILKVILTPLLLLFTMIVNVIALIFNKIDIDETFTTGYTVLVKLQPRISGADPRVLGAEKT